MRAEAFLDSSYAIALAAPSDQLHARAAALAEELETDRTHRRPSLRLSKRRPPSPAKRTRSVQDGVPTEDRLSYLKKCMHHLSHSQKRVCGSLTLMFTMVYTTANNCFANVVHCRDGLFLVSSKINNSTKYYY